METGPIASIRSRRNFIVGAAAAAGTAATLIPSAAYAVGGGTAISGFFDVTKAPYNADPTGATSSSTAINNAIAAAQANGGGIVWLPPGKYLLTAGLTITSQVVLCGAGWGTPPQENPNAATNATGNGSWISISSISFTPITIMGRGATVRDLAFIHTQPTNVTTVGWVPQNYPFTIECNVDDVHLENLFFRNATRAIVIRGYVISPPAPARTGLGRVSLRHIWGQPIWEGINIDDVFDIVRIDDVDFWPFWSGTDPVMAFQRLGDCRALTCQKVDGILISNFFAFGYRRAFYFTQSTNIVGGFTSEFQMSNCVVDSCPVGLEIDADNTFGKMSNFYTLGGPSSLQGITVDANGVVLMCSNVTVKDIGGEGIRVSGTGTQASIENLWVFAWDQASLGFAGVSVLNGAHVMLGHGRYFSGSTSPQTATGSSGTISIDN